MNKELNLKLLKEISYENVSGCKNEQYNDYLINLLLNDLFYYMKTSEKIVNFEPTLDGLENFLFWCQQLFDRNTDILDAFYCIHLHNYGKEGHNDFTETHKMLLSELDGNKRTYKMSDIFKEAIAKVMWHKANK